MAKKYLQQQTKIDSRAEGTYQSYSLGYILSVVATLIPYFALQYHLTAGKVFIVIAICAAVVQLFVQLALFLHLSFAKRSLNNMIIFLYAVTLVITIVAGSLWIMANLNQHMMQSIYPSNDYSPQTEAY